MVIRHPFVAARSPDLLRSLGPLREHRPAVTWLLAPAMTVSHVAQASFVSQCQATFSSSVTQAGRHR